MVNDRGILYTIEGITAGILMITTTYLILSTTSIYTPGETHISDMQLEQIGYDVLAVMDTPLTDIGESNLSMYIQTENGGDQFRDEFLTLATFKASYPGWSWNERINFTADVYFRNTSGGSGVIDSYHFSDWGNLTGSEHLVMVTRRVLVTNATNLSMKQGAMNYHPDNRNQSVLLEVLMWRD